MGVLTPPPPPPPPPLPPQISSHLVSHENVSIILFIDHPAEWYRKWRFWQPGDVQDISMLNVLVLAFPGKYNLSLGMPTS